MYLFGNISTTYYDYYCTVVDDYTIEQAVLSGTGSFFRFKRLIIDEIEVEMWDNERCNLAMEYLPTMFFFFLVSSSRGTWFGVQTKDIFNDDNNENTRAFIKHLKQKHDRRRIAETSLSTTSKKKKKHNFRTRPIIFPGSPGEMLKSTIVPIHLCILFYNE